MDHPAPAEVIAVHRKASAGRPAGEAARAAGSALPQRPPPRLSCVIPCCNEAENLVVLLPQLARTLGPCVPAWEVILVDDGSTDATAEVMARWARVPGFVALELSRNFGKEAALTAGLQAASGEVVVLMDADLQHPTRLIPTFVEHWRAGADVVYARRADRDDEGLLKRLGARGFYTLLNAAGRFEIPAGAGDFRLMDRRVVDALLALPERNRFMKGLYAWVGFKAEAVSYHPDQRAHGRSHFDLGRLVLMSLDGLTAFTHWPLRAVSAIGSLLAVLALLYGAFLVVSHLLWGHPVSGWTTIAVSLMLFAGIQLISLGVVGEYVGRIFEEVKSRPLFIVRRRSGQGLPVQAR